MHLNEIYSQCYKINLSFDLKFMKIGPFRLRFCVGVLYDFFDMGSAHYNTSLLSQHRKPEHTQSFETDSLSMRALNRVDYRM